jgi:hypothetical protein
VGTIWIAAERAEDVPTIKKNITQLMRERRHLSPAHRTISKPTTWRKITQVIETTTRES